MRPPPSERTGPENTHAFVAELLGEEVHMMRVTSLTASSVLHAAALGIHPIGRGLADALDLDPKHAVKEVDRLLSNTGIEIWDWFARRVTFVVASRKEILVALDWTEFDKDGHSAIALYLYLVSSHGRATPLIWKTVDKSKLKNRREEWELSVINRLHEILAKGVDIMVLADRGFGDQRLFAYLETIDWSYAIRFKQNTTVPHDGQSKPAADRVPSSGHAKMLRDVRILGDVGRS